MTFLFNRFNFEIAGTECIAGLKAYPALSGWSRGSRTGRAPGALTFWEPKYMICLLFEIRSFLKFCHTKTIIKIL